MRTFDQERRATNDGRGNVGVLRNEAAGSHVDVQEHACGLLNPLGHQMGLSADHSD